MKGERRRRTSHAWGCERGAGGISSGVFAVLTCTPVGKLIVPSIDMPCTELSTCPRSSVGVTSTRGTLPARLSTPTLFSGFDCVLAPASRLMASASACRVFSKKMDVGQRSERGEGLHTRRGGGGRAATRQRRDAERGKEGRGGGGVKFHTQRMVGSAHAVSFFLSHARGERVVYFVAGATSSHLQPRRKVV